MKVPTNQIKNAASASTLLGVLAACLGAVVLLGWTFDIATFKSVFPGLVTMKANTALGLLLSGGALAILSRERMANLPRSCAAALATFVTALGLLTLGEYFFGWNLGIDELLFRDVSQSVGTSQPGRMSPSTAYCFVMTGSALGMASLRIPQHPRFSMMSALGATLIVMGGVGSVGQIANELLDIRLWNYFGMAVHTAMGFVLLGAGLLAFVKSEAGMTWTLDKMTTIAFATAVAIMLTAAGISWNYIIQLQDAAAWVSHTHQVLKEIEDVRADKANLEGGQRGYLILGDERLLAPREQLKADVREDIEDLRRLTSDDPHQKPRLDELEPLFAQRTEFAEKLIAVRRQQGFPAAQSMLATGPGLALSAGIERVLGAMRDEENSLLATREKHSAAVSTAAFLLLPVGVFLSLTILSLALFFLNAGMTERNLAEEASAQLAAIVNSSNDAIIGKDLNSSITSWNIGAERIFGYAANEMIGAPITRLIPPDRQQEEMQIIEQIKSGGTVEHFDTVRVAKDGHLIDIAVTVSPIKDKTGRIVGASKVARDISERKLAEKALQEQRDFIGAVVDTVGSLVVVIDRKARIIRFNRACEQLTGYPFDEVRGQNLIDLLIMPEERATTTHEFNNLCAGQFPNTYENHWLTREGSPRVIAWSNTALVDADGQVEFVIGTGVDITERKQAEQEIRELNTQLEQRVAERTAQLQASNKELEAFSYSVSHDLRAPLRAVDGFSQALLEDYGAQLPEEGQHYLQTIRAGAQRMGRLIDDLLAFSRLSRTALRKQEINTTSMVRHVLEELEYLQKDRTINIKLADLPPCQGDPALLEQVWVNLLSNALKYTSHTPAAVVEIGTRQEENETVYFVRDNGAGFDMRYAQKLFGVFQRLHRHDEFEGTGVGLAIVQRIINRHGGRIWAEAEVNQGATFYFTLAERNSS